MRMHQRVASFALFVIAATAVGAQETADGRFERGVRLYQEGQHQRALDEFELAIAAYRESDNEAGEMNAALWAGAASYHRGAFDAARGFYERSYSLAQSIGDAAVAANVATARANLENALTEYAAAGPWYLAAAEHFAQLGQPAQSRQSREYGAYVLILAGEYEEPLNVFRESLEDTSGRTPIEQAWLAGMAGQALYGLGELDDALANYVSARDIQLAANRRSVEASQYTAWVGRILFERGADQEAIAALQRSAEIARSVRSASDESRAVATVGLVHATHARFGPAMEAFEQSLAIAEAAKIREFVTPALQSLISLATDAGETERAANYLARLSRHARSIGDLRLEADSENERGILLLEQGDASQAIVSFESALRLERELGNPANEAVVLLNLGVAQDDAGLSDEAVLSLRESIELVEDEDALLVLGGLLEQLGRPGATAEVLGRLLPFYANDGERADRMHLLNNLGNALTDAGRYLEAEQRYTDALAISREHDDDLVVAIHLHNRGRARAFLSRFDEALRDFSESAEVAALINADSQQNAQSVREIRGQIENSIGELYRAWGWFDRSMIHYERAIEELGPRASAADIGSVLNNMGQAVRQAGDPRAAIELYETALAGVRNHSLQSDTTAEAIYLSNLGEAYRQLSDYERARELYREALRLDLEAQRPRGINIRSSNLGLLELEAGNYSDSIPYFERALAYWRSTGETDEEAGALTNLGYAYVGLGDLRRAEEAFADAVEIHEQLRLTATGNARREYLQNQIDVYRNLAIVRFDQGDLWGALHAIELSRAKGLLEQMRQSPLRSIALDFDRFLAIRDRLDPQTAVLSINRLDDETFLIATLTVDGLSASIRTIDSAAIPAGAEERTVPSLLTRYRALLGEPFLTRNERAQLAEYAAWLHNAFVEPGVASIGDLTTLMIVPEGELGTVPFETFTSDGSFLIERYDIAYAPSLFVALEAMERRYGDDRREMLALGGALYSGAAGSQRAGDRYGARIDDPVGQRLLVEERVRRGQDLLSNYRSLGLDAWSDLPGAAEEVRAIAEIVDGTRLVTGDEVSESLVKRLSDLGDLARYRTIHFATHGVVVPDVPELSAVVLSQGLEEGEDGYLTMSEISQLRLEADFVNLSACETGLGRVYRGEGIVGLTQAFLVAGAKSLSVSLWQIDDEVTRLFMTSLYELAISDGLTYVQAISQIKRRFLADRLTSAPYYWAPFAFYGDYRVRANDQARP